MTVREPGIEIRYRRPPDRLTVFRQHLVHRTDDCVVTLLERAPVKRPVMVDGAVVLECDAPIVWFTFPDRWHDIGRFHTRDGTFTGYYANVLTPVRFVSPQVWETTDLFLDVWLDARGAVLLDEDEFDSAMSAHRVDAEVGERARAEADTVLGAARGGDWPPEICRHWTLERARAAASSANAAIGADASAASGAADVAGAAGRNERHLADGGGVNRV